MRTLSYPTLRFLVWQYCNPRGWDVTTGEIAEAVGISKRSAIMILRHAGWMNRVRSSTTMVRGIGLPVDSAELFEYTL